MIDHRHIYTDAPPPTRGVPHRCEDCGDPATQQTADGVWLCEGDFDLLLDASIWTQEGDRL